MNPDRPLPCNLDAERFVLGTMLLDEGAVHESRAVLVPEDFQLERHQIIWRAMCSLYDAGAAIDRVTVANSLMTGGGLEQVGGLSYLVSLDEGLPKIHNLDSYIQIVKDKSALRQIIRITADLQDRAYCGREGAQAIINDLSAVTLSDHLDGGTKGPVSAKEIITAHGLDALFAPRRNTGIPLPWSELDRILCGFQPGQMIILAAYTSRGKTSLALQVAAHTARHGHGVVYFGLEMSNEQNFVRMCCQLARVDSDRLRHGVCTADERGRLARAAAELAECPLWFKPFHATLPGIHADVRSVSVKHPVGLVVVDHLQLLSGTGRHESRSKEVGAYSRGLKLAAGDFGCPFLVLSQLRRPDPGPSGKVPRPSLHMLKESGDIENDADAVLLICDSEDRQRMDERTLPVEVEIAKQREGVRDVSAAMWFYTAFQRFEGAAEE